jgi:hypothetical protein
MRLTQHKGLGALKAVGGGHCDRHLRSGLAHRKLLAPAAKGVRVIVFFLLFFLFLFLFFFCRALVLFFTPLTILTCRLRCPNQQSWTPRRWRRQSTRCGCRRHSRQ